MSIPDKAVVAVHRAICEDSLEECIEWDGRCVQAIEAAAPYMMESTK